MAAPDRGPEIADQDGTEGPVEDASASRRLEEDGGLALRISNALSALMRECGGKGPDRCKTYLEDDLVIAVMRGGFTPAERTLLEAGRWHDVRRAREAFQDSVRGRFCQTIGELTGREVLAFMSTAHQDPDLTLEVFLLEPGSSP
jgi:uncharacterized protein YbcI